MHACIHTYIHTYIHIYIYMCEPDYMCRLGDSMMCYMKPRANDFLEGLRIDRVQAPAQDLGSRSTAALTRNPLFHSSPELHLSVQGRRLKPKVHPVSLRSLSADSGAWEASARRKGVSWTQSLRARLFGASVGCFKLWLLSRALIDAPTLRLCTGRIQKRPVGRI